MQNNAGEDKDGAKCEMQNNAGEDKDGDSRIGLSRVKTSCMNMQGTKLAHFRVELGP
jgi:hypothetical protein